MSCYGPLCKITCSKIDNRRSSSSDGVYLRMDFVLGFIHFILNPHPGCLLERSEDMMTSNPQKINKLKKITWIVYTIVFISCTAHYRLNVITAVSSAGLNKLDSLWLPHSHLLYVSGRRVCSASGLLSQETRSGTNCYIIN